MARPVQGRFCRASLKLHYNTIRVANSVLYLMDTSALVIIGKPPSGSPRNVAFGWDLLFLFIALRVPLGAFFFPFIIIKSALL